VIKDTISDQGEIAGTFTAQQTQDLAMILRSGALPASIHFLEERTVGPSLVRIPFARACGLRSSAWLPS